MGEKDISGGLKILCFSFNLVLYANFIPEFSGTFLSYRNNFYCNEFYFGRFVIMRFDGTHNFRALVF